MSGARAPSASRLFPSSLLLVLLILPAGPAPAATAPAPAELARRLATVAPGTLLRVRCDDGVVHEGRFAAVTADSLTLVAAGGKPVHCPLAT
ncbi:MAG: hypothetical protein IH626_02540, partial [Rhodospirillales bacterium]|nr:hypothetical protein [Rhodospirillales bacterium]